jgi:hypothetical protein
VRDAGGGVRYAADSPLTRPAPTVTHQHLAATALPPDDCLNIATLATLGEAELAPGPDATRCLLGLGGDRFPAPQGPERAAHRRAGPIGQRRPQRDPIGVHRPGGQDG